jgi:hypothetical protein
MNIVQVLSRCSGVVDHPALLVTAPGVRHWYEVTGVALDVSEFVLKCQFTASFLTR